MTPAGESYVRSAKEILNRIEKAHEAAMLAGEGLLGELSVGAVWSFTSGPIVDLLTSFRAAYPSVALRLVEHADDDLISRLLKGELDVAVTASFSTKSERDGALEGLGHAPLWSERLCVAMPSTNAPTTLGWEHLRDRKLICRPAGEWRRFVAYVERHGGPKLTYVEQDVSWEGVLGLVAAGLGWAVMPASLAPVQVEGVAVVPVEAAGAELGVEVVWNRNTANSTLSHFLALARDMFARQPTGPVSALSKRRDRSP